MYHSNTSRVLAWGLLVLGFIAACGPSGKRFKAGPPAAGDGITVRVKKAEGRKDRVRVSLEFTNETDFEAIVNKNQIAIVGPSGKSYYRSSGRGETELKPGKSKTVSLYVRDTEDFMKAPGFFVRFDGVWIEGRQLRISPLVIGRPTGDAGSPEVAFAAPEAKKPKKSRAEKKKERRSLRQRIFDKGKDKDKDKAEEVAEATRGTPAPPPIKEAGMERYAGHRRKIKESGTKCAAMPLRAKKVPEDVAFIMDEILLGELFQAGFQAVGPDDINAMIGFESMKEAVGCDDIACIAEIGNALGVQYVTQGNVGKVAETTVFSLKLLDVRNQKVVARVNRMAEGGHEVLPRIIAEAVQELVDSSNL